MAAMEGARASAVDLLCLAAARCPTWSRAASYGLLTTFQSALDADGDRQFEGWFG
jgi:hypothetical protein